MTISINKTFQNLRDKSFRNFRVQERIELIDSFIINQFNF